MQFVNHASFKILSDKNCLVIDPWYDGAVFNNGWALAYQDEHQNLSDLHPTAILISHEHPDHFHLPTLLSIPQSERRNIRVYFQETLDRRMLEWCLSNGYPATECIDGEEIRLDEGLSFRVFKVGLEDSALLIRLRNKTLLNLNDCLFPHLSALRELQAKCGAVDFVGYLYSYAEGGGSPHDDTFRRIMANVYIQRFDSVWSTFQSSRVFGFAAFKYFCHVENFFQNDHLGVDLIKKRIIESQGQVGLVAPNQFLENMTLESSLDACTVW